MVKLNSNEIYKQMYKEGAFGYEGKRLPKGAKSVFMFEIKENVADVMNNVMKGNDNWNLMKDEDHNIYLCDKNFNGERSYAKIKKVDKNKINIKTAWNGYDYVIENNHKGGSKVVFKGAVNALLAQNLLPEMTYVHHTLSGRFVDDNGNKLTDWMEPNEFGLYREIKNGNDKNCQDVYGGTINSKFNDELTFLPKSKNTNVNLSNIVMMNIMANKMISR